MALWGAPRRKTNGAPGGITLKPCGEGWQKSTSSGGSARCRKCENQPKSVLAMNPVRVTVGANSSLSRQALVGRRVPRTLLAELRVLFESQVASGLAYWKTHDVPPYPLRRSYPSTEN